MVANWVVGGRRTMYRLGNNKTSKDTIEKKQGKNKRKRKKLVSKNTPDEVQQYEWSNHVDQGK